MKNVGKSGLMKFRVALDSGGELTPELEGREEFVSVPLMLMVNGVHIVDDGHISQKEMVDRIAQDPDCPKTACPSPEPSARTGIQKRTAPSSQSRIPC